MTETTPPLAVIVLGASGRVGRELLPLLADGTRTVVGVVRDRKPDLTRPDLHWIQVDVTERTVWQRSLLALSGIASTYERTIVIDLVLARTTVASMRRSITDATGYVRELTSAITERGSTPLLVAASTTAVLAPYLYQTPYGLAKRRQAETYAAMTASQIMLLPTLMLDGEHCIARWSYRTAALAVAHTVQAAADAASPHGRLWVPDTLSARSPRGPLIGVLTSTLSAHIRCFLTHRDDPWAHRQAARGRLDLTPRALRDRADHHLAPQHLTAAFAHSTGLLVEPMTMHRNDQKDPAPHE